MIKSSSTRVQISFPNDVLSKIDSFANKHNLTRSAACLFLISESIATEEVINMIPQNLFNDFLQKASDEIKKNSALKA